VAAFFPVCLCVVAAVAEMRLLQFEVTHKKTRLHFSVETGLSCSLVSVVRDRGQATLSV
jgi:hypothetical protein